jgi:hypothetical protein
MAANKKDALPRADLLGKLDAPARLTAVTLGLTRRGGPLTAVFLHRAPIALKLTAVLSNLIAAR